jgi:hypothetical protein
MDTAGSFQQPKSTPNGSPLRQLSSDQMNQRIPLSPSMPEFNNENYFTSQHRSRESISSDVQSRVAFLNSLSNPSSPTKNFRGFGHTPTNGALQRALLGFEESQASLATANAEIDKLNEQVRSAAHRERLVSERIESLMDQLQTERESRNGDKKFYVAEVKKCRKQAYQAELNQLETQESLKEAKQDLKRAQAEVVAERTKKDEARQEAFERAYAVSGLTEEIETLKATMQALEKERDNAIMELRTAPTRESTQALLEEKAVQAQLSPVKQHVTHNSASETTPRPIKRSYGETESPLLPSASATHNIGSDHVCCKAPSTLTEPFWTDFVERDRLLKEYDEEDYTLEDHVQSLYQEVKGTRQIADRQREQIEFMKLECQAGCCACRRAEKRGERYIFDPEFERIRDGRAAKKRKVVDAEQREVDVAHSASTAMPEVSVHTLGSPPELVAAERPESYAVEEAAHVPLPSPTEREFASKEPSPEPTALLEEMTQVLVEPTKAAEHFTFSTSTSIHRTGHVEIIVPLESHVVSEATDVDLFDVSQPKHYPPRPSTAMGILSVPSPERSPIRLVPDSPQPSTLPPRAATAFDARHTYSSHTTRVALKDSPARSHRRTQSRPNVRSQSRTRSPLTKSESARHFDKSTSASPASSTVYPLTPVAKNHRGYNQQTVTTTTTVPLRDTEDGNNSQYGDTVSHSQPLHLHNGNPDIHAPTGPSSSQLLKGVTGTPVSRDAALAQIRARRDRARSMNMKKMGEVGSKTPGSARRGINLREGTGGHSRENREVSVASVQTAPGRF